MTSLPWALRPWVATFMRLRVLRVTPASVKACAAIGVLRAMDARSHALCVRRGIEGVCGALCSARVALSAPGAVSAPAGEPFPLQWGAVDLISTKIPPNVIRTH